MLSFNLIQDVKMKTQNGFTFIKDVAGINNKFIPLAVADSMLY